MIVNLQLVKILQLRIYSDLDLDFMRNHTTSDLTKLEDVECKRSVKNLIQTNHYERLFILK